MALSSLLISSLNAILAAYGQMYVMILGVYYKLQTFLYLPANGIIQGMRPLIGYNYGAGEQKRVHKLYSYTLYLSAGIMLAGTLLCMIIRVLTWTLYHQPADDRIRKHGTSYHQSGIYRIFGIHHFLRGTRRSGKRRTVSDDFALPLYDPDPSAGISSEPHRWTDRRLACVLDL